MITITIRDWTGLVTSVTDMSEQELGYDNDIKRLKTMAQNIANVKTCSVKIEQDNKVLAQASYVEGML